jgi:signal transduction histidine kinase
VASALLVLWISASRFRAQQLLRQERVKLGLKIEAQTNELRRANEELLAEITERKRAEEVVQRNEREQRELAIRLETERAQLVAAQAVAKVGSWETDLSTLVAIWSAETYRIFETDPDQFAPTHQGFLQFVHPEDRAAMAEEFVQSLDRHSPSALEHRILMSDGRIKFVEEHWQAFHHEDGKPVRAIGTCQDVTDRKLAERALRDANEQLRTLSRRLFQVQEDEKRHLARELHDQIGQTLTAAKLNLKIIAPDAPPAIAGRLGDSIQILDRLLQQVRELSLDLRPPLLDELGLAPALRWLADQQTQRSALRVTFTANVEVPDIDPAVQTACFRVAQEAITNAIRHARAETVAIQVHDQGGRLWLSVRDNGMGFNPDEAYKRASRGASLGVLGMKERVLLTGGMLEVHSTPEMGTEIRAWFPLAPPENCAAKEHQ